MGIRGKRERRFITGTGRRYLARADNVAERGGALRWAVCFREGSQQVRRQSRLVGKIQNSTLKGCRRRVVQLQLSYASCFAAALLGFRR